MRRQGMGLVWHRPRLAQMSALRRVPAPPQAPAAAVNVRPVGSTARGGRGGLPRAGAMTQAEADAFIGGLERASAENRFFGASTFYAYVVLRLRGPARRVARRPV